MAYEFTLLHQNFSIDRIVMVHYFEYSANFEFEGEAHDFWEFLYVDRGSVLITAGNEHYKLNKDEIIFHKPQEFHAVSAQGGTPNLVVVSFDCCDACMSFFENKRMRVDPDLRINLQNIVREAKHAFESDLSDPFLTKLKKRDHPAFGCEQMIKCFLEQLLIELYRRNSGETHVTTRHTTQMEFDPILRQYTGSQTFNMILEYMNRNIGRQLWMQDICQDNRISRSAAQKLFNELTGGGVMEYFNRMKIEYAKVLIREKNMNITQIAQTLGYSSIHYFSRQFRVMSGMTPTEYSKSVL